MWRQWNHQRNHCTVMWHSSRVGSICCLKSSVFGFFFCWPRWSGSFFSSVAFFLRAWLSGFVCFVVREKCLLFQLCYQWLSKHSSHTRQVWSIFFCVVVVWFLICLHSNKGLQNYCTFIYGCNCQCQMSQCPTGRAAQPDPLMIALLHTLDSDSDSFCVSAVWWPYLWGLEFCLNFAGNLLVQRSRVLGSSIRERSRNRVQNQKLWLQEVSQVENKIFHASLLHS